MDTTSATARHVRWAARVSAGGLLASRWGGPERRIRRPALILHVRLIYPARARFLTRSGSFCLSATFLVAFDNDPICRLEEGQRHAGRFVAAFDDLDRLARVAGYEIPLFRRVVVH